MRLWKTKRADTCRTDGLVVECEAFLSGRYREYLAAQNRPVPGWAWINQLAHGSLDDVRSMAGHPVADDPLSVVVDLARRVVGLIDAGLSTLEGIQRQTLIPLELALAKRHPTDVPCDARRLSASIRSSLIGGLPPVNPDRRTGLS
jgi:hypothetical protein